MGAQHLITEYRGLKNNFLSAVTYVYQLTSLGMGLEAASLSLQTNDPQQWLVAQSQFQLLHRSALYRIQDFYKTAVRETTHNSQINLAKYVKNNPSYFASTDYDNVTLTVQNALQLVASNKQWFVNVYQVTTDYNLIHSARCLDCFTVFSVNSDYHIFIAGVDTNAEPNPSVQFHNWIDFERAKDYTQDLQGFADDVFNTYCVYGVMAVQNKSKSSMLFPDNWPSTGWVYVKDRILFLVWAVKDICPGWDE